MLEISGLSKTYGSFQLGPIDLTIADEIVAILGPSGCGKTTLLSIIAGIEQADRGSVTLDDRRLDGRPPEDRNVGLVFQDGALFPHMTARENIAYAAADDADIESLAATLDVTSLLDQNVTSLSGGERQRIALARSLAARPDALLLDEPLANLDAPIKRRLRFDLRDHLSALEVPVIYVTHDREQGTVVGDRIAVMDRGRIQQYAAPEIVFRRPSNRFVASFTGSDNLYRATVIQRDTDGLTLSWGGYTLTTPAYSLDENEVWFCIRPRDVEVLDEDQSPEAYSNVIPGQIRRRVFEGDDYILFFEPDKGEEIEIRLSVTVYERLSLDERDRVRISLAREAIHLMESDQNGATVGGGESNRSHQSGWQRPY